MKNINPFSFLENSFLTFKEMINGDVIEPPEVISDELLKLLKTELDKIKNYCTELNKTKAIAVKCNKNLKQNTKELSLELFFISDLISIVNQVVKSKQATETLISRMILAYYYDALKNNHFALPQKIKEYNRLISQPSFINLIEKIKQDNQLEFITDHNLVLMNAVENEKQNNQLYLHYANFISLAFSIKLEDRIQFDAFFNQQSNEKNKKEIPTNDSLEKVLKELDALIGLQNVKTEIHELVNLLSIQKKRTQKGLKNVEITLHSVFLGAPGTGKTTVARLMGRIYKHLGFLPDGHIVETDREGMVAGFVGQTAIKVEKVISESLGGVLFIDEAYALTEGGTGSDYGSEAVNTLLKRMEDHRENLAVIVAGYTTPMKYFVESNPGLRSRFNRYFQFEHFNAEQLLQIFQNLCKGSDFILDKDAEEKLMDTFDLLLSKKDDSFGNARLVRNIFEKIIQNQANRIISDKKLSEKILKTIVEEDIPEPRITLEQTYFTATN